MPSARWPRRSWATSPNTCPRPRPTCRHRSDGKGRRRSGRSGRSRRGGRARTTRRPTGGGAAAEGVPRVRLRPAPAGRLGAPALAATPRAHHSMPTEATPPLLRATSIATSRRPSAAPALAATGTATRPTTGTATSTCAWRRAMAPPRGTDPVARTPTSSRAVAPRVRGLIRTDAAAAAGERAVAGRPEELARPGLLTARRAPAPARRPPTPSRW
mmetsp:Transcript_5484/g.21617  ORF Transcript_5484/g.21617 Transcript_5484/m.21617 type:complete len:215 (-) Transcript_5484:842-1486(-)